MSSLRAVSNNESGKSKSLIAVVVLVVVALVAAAVYWFVIRDDDSADGDDGSSQTLKPQTFSMDDVPFTFEYPGNFAEAEPSAAGIVWVAGVSPVDILNVKRIANESSSLSQIKQSVTDTLSRRSEIEVTGVGTEQTGDIKMLRFTANSTASGQQLRSQLYYFPMGDAVWQLECQSRDTARAEIAGACAGMLETLTER